ncbi:MAG: hypothetical protein P4L43_18280 [Syntrophobacteraceae bacterium]|nr:hypothetical protein [Syntrophobacteraceae bacterium]
MDTGNGFAAIIRRYTDNFAFGLVDGVQVRREKFGLLFYDYKGPKIYFVPSGGLVGEDFFGGINTLGQLADGLEIEHRLPRKKILTHLESLLEKLETKGLIHGQPLC